VQQGINEEGQWSRLKQTRGESISYLKTKFSGDLVSTGSVIIDTEFGMENYIKSVIFKYIIFRNNN
jgi:hypothetical protein